MKGGDRYAEQRNEDSIGVGALTILVGLELLLAIFDQPRTTQNQAPAIAPEPAIELLDWRFIEGQYYSTYAAKPGPTGTATMHSWNSRSLTKTIRS